MPDVFVSHVQDDKMDGTELARALELAGYSVWFYERDSLPGPAYIDQIVRAIDSIKVMILLISRRALQSEQMDREVVRAFQHAKRIVPVLKDLSFEEFQKLKPSWDHILGAAGALEIGGGGVPAIVPRLISGLAAMGLAPLDERGGDQPQQTWSPVAQPSVSISELAQELGLSAPMLMRKARDVFGRDIRTPLHALTPELQSNCVVALEPKPVRTARAG